MPSCRGCRAVRACTARDGHGGQHVLTVGFDGAHALADEACLAEEPGTVFTRQRLLEEVWAPHWYGPTRTLDVHVASLRKKLGDPGWIETVRGIGFRLGDPS